MRDRTQKTPAGHEIPVPERDEILSAFERIAGPQRGRDQGQKATEPDAAEDQFKKRRGPAEP